MSRRPAEPLRAGSANLQYHGVLTGSVCKWKPVKFLDPLFFSGAVTPNETQTSPWRNVK